MESETIIEEILVGHKSAIIYAYRIRSVVGSGTTEVILKARGKSIPTAVDAAEVSKRLLEDFQVEVTNIKIGTDSFEKDGRTINVSFMEISMAFAPNTKKNVT